MNGRAFLISACAAASLAPALALADVDHSDPAAVTSAVFDAAVSADLSDLPGLCDPRGENDGDTQRYICDMTIDSADWGAFVDAFAKARVSGPAVIGGSTARVPFLFGPDGTRQETMNLILRDGKWYLSSF